MDPFIDSEMTFGPYPTGQGFRVDGSAPHDAAGQGVKMIDFYKLDLPAGKPPRLWLIEAKKSTPNADSPNYEKSIKVLDKMRSRLRRHEHANAVSALISLVQTHGNILSPIISSDYDIYIGDICGKMNNGLSLFFSARAGRWPSHINAWPEDFTKVDVSSLQVRILLIVKTAETGSLSGLQDGLRKAMRATIGTWALGPDSIVVLNEDGARRRGFVNDDILA
jgi:hypothetical protein